MRRSNLSLLGVSLSGLLVWAAGCGDNTSQTTTASASGSAAGGEGGKATGGAGGASGGMGGDAGTIFVGSNGSGGMGGGGDLCAGVGCDPDQHCEVQNGMASCVPNTCGQLGCSATEICEITPNGAICKDNSCTSDVQCAVSQFCNGTICLNDICAPGATTCVNQDVYECNANGGGQTQQFTCGSTTYFPSMCMSPQSGMANCPCEDDWDCPPNTKCEAGACTGTGKAPTCTLPAVPFSQVLPTKEIQWGGTGSGSPANNAVNAPYPVSAQVSMTPLVANLDDDNGDGLINELDFAEIIFMTYCNTDAAVNGIVRAIHGGGPNKGKDYFAYAGPDIWHEGDPLNATYTCANAIGNSTGTPAVGDIDGDGVPEIVVPSEILGFFVLDNRGELIMRADNQWLATGHNVPAVAIANVDGKGFAEVVVGKNVFTFAKDMATNKLILQDKFAGTGTINGNNGQGPISCIANLVGDNAQEIVAGSTVYSFPIPPAGVTKRADCMMGDLTDFCNGRLTMVWDAQTVNGTVAVPNAQREGYCAIADILGTDEAIAPSPQNPLNGKPEVVLISAGYLTIYNGETGVQRRFVNLNAGTNGGAPNIDDFDGDGFPEVGTAFGLRYMMIDLQDPSMNCPAWPNALSDAVMGNQGNTARMPGATCMQDADCNAGAVCNKIKGECTCLHNGWQRITEDDSSRVTSSSVFDFNGDGAAEVVYNDECWFRIYDGTNANVLFKSNSPSRTRTENPVIADVDNDGNAEIVFCSNNDTSSCSAGFNYPNGIAVWGDASDTWVSARRIWNEHAYHVTNVLESGGVPVKEPESWKPYNGRQYNTYRSNPRSYGVAPDLTVTGIQLSSPDAACGQLSKKLDITVEIRNDGDERVGPGVVIAFYGEWAGGMPNEPLYADMMQTKLTAVLQSNLEPGDSILLTVSYDSANNSPMVLPAMVRAVVDDTNAQRECRENNNELTAPVMPSDVAPDLRVDLGLASDAMCPKPTVLTTVYNDGSAPASNIVVRYYAGDPNAGGTVVHEEIIPGPLDPGQSVMLTPQISNFPPGLLVLLYAVVDPANAITECNDGNNKDAANNKIVCGVN